MSNNLFKFNSFYGVMPEPEKRIINTNEIAAKRLETLAEIMKTSAEKGDTQNFVQGLDAKEVSLLLEEEAEESGNVIKGNSAEYASTLVEQAQDEAADIVSNAKIQAETIVKEALEQAENTKKNVIEEARMHGYREGINRANKEVDQIKEELAQKEKALEAEYDAQMKSMESDLVEVITGIYEHIFNVELSSQREILVHLISATMRKSDSSRSFIIHVSRDDYPFVSMQKKQLMAGVAGINSNVEIVEDMTLGRMECMIETDGGIFDCGLGTQLGELSKKLKLLSYTNK